MNRTFYSLNPLTCAYFAKQGMVYEDTETGSVTTLGARFMPWQSLHIGLISGDHEACLRFALQEGLKRNVERLSILWPPGESDIERSVTGFGFRVSREDFITLGITV